LVRGYTCRFGLRLLFLLPGLGLINTEELRKIVAINHFFGTVICLLCDYLDWRFKGSQCLRLIACVDDRRHHRVCLRGLHSFFYLVICAYSGCFALVFVESFAVFDFGMSLLGLI